MHCRSRLATLFACLLFTTSALAQMTGVTDDQSTPVPGVPHDYIKLLSETVSPANGAVSVRITVPVPSARKQPMPFSINYDSNGTAGMSVTTCAATNLSPCPTGLTTAPYAAAIAPLGMYTTGGWTYGTPMLTHTVENVQKVRDQQTGTYYVCFFDTNYVFQDPSGGRHPLNVSYVYDNQPDCAQFPIGTFSSAEGSFYQASLTDLPLEKEAFWQVTGSDGTTYTFPQNATTPPRNGQPSGPPTACDPTTNPCAIYTLAGGEDRNGNLSTAAVTNLTVPPYHSPVAVGDDLKRGFTAPALGSNGTFTVPGLTGSYSIVWGTEPGRTVSASTTNAGTDTHCVFVSKTPSEPAISSITLPNEQKYTFLYDSTWGTIKQITYPTGGWVKYTWNWNLKSEAAIFPDTQPGNPPTCEFFYATPVVTQRTVSYDGTNVAQTQTFTYQTLNWSFPKWGSKQTTVSTTDNVRGITSSITYTYSSVPSTPGPNQAWSNYFAGQIPIESKIVYKDFNGQTLKTIYKGWNAGAQPELPVCELEQLDSSGPISAMFYSYAPGPQGGYPIGDAITDKKEYDYGLITSPTSCSNNATAPNITPTRETVTSYQAFANTPLFSFGPSILDRPCQIITKGSGSKLAETDYFYDNGSTATPCGTAGTPSVASAGGSSITGHDSTNYSTSSPTAPRGNVTTRTVVCLQSGCPNAITKYTYDETGQVVSRTDPNGNQTTYSYADSFFSTDANGFTNTGGSPPSGEVANAYLSKITRPVTNGVNHIGTFSYGFNSGELTRSIDENSQTTTYQYNESLGQPTQLNYADGGQTSISYNDVPPSPTVTTSRLITSSLTATSVAVSDGMGHVVQTKLASDPDCSTGDIVATTYDGMGRVYTVSNPYCTTGDPTYGLTTYTYDALGRTTKVAHFPDGTFATTTYTGRATDVIDEGNGTRSTERISQVDALGRLVSICEVTSSSQLGAGGTPAACNQDINKTGFVTTYNYGALNNLLNVNQGSLSQRTFTYDSLSRLLCAANPETGGSATCPNPDTGAYTPGTTRYSYDANGNVTTRVRPAPNQKSASTTVKTTYQYDPLNRLTQKSYSDGVTLPAQFGYDQSTITIGSQQVTITNSVGRLTSTCVLHNSSPSCPFMTGNSYDPMGRIAQFWQSDQANSSNLWVAYQYDLIGDETSHNFTGSQYALAYNSAGHLTAFTAQNFIDATNPANILASGHYDAFGHLISAALANGLTESWAYDNRGRPHAFAVGTNCSAGICTGSTVYSNSILNPSTGQTGYSPNGDILFANDNVNGNWAYIYDDFNRLVSSNENSGQQTYTYDYDRYGNRWHQNPSNGGFSSLLSFSGNNNRIDSYSYDAEGNLLNDGFHNYQYDPEDRIISVDGNTTYTYDANGRRVFKSAGSTQTEIAHDAQGNVSFYVTKAGGNTPVPNSPNLQLYAGGMHIGSYVVNSTATDTIFYYNHADWLGTERARTNLSGVACETIANLPFGDGETIAGSCGDISPMHFTGKERDSESGLDNFGARYNASSMGRFMTPDPIMIMKQKFRDPQQWNMYAYARNNPARFIDPRGMYNTDCKGSDITQCSKTIQNFEDNLQKDLQSKDPAVRAAAAGFGSFNDKNKVDVKFDANAHVGHTTQEVVNGKATDRVSVTMPTGGKGVNPGDAGLIAHEGTHIQDIQSSMAGRPVTQYASEMKAYMTQAGTIQDFAAVGDLALGTFTDSGVSMLLLPPTNPAASEVDEDRIQQFLASDPTYRLTPGPEGNQGGPVGVPPQ